MTTQTLAEIRQEQQQQLADKNERAERARADFPAVGSVWHVLKSGFMIGGRIFSRGDTFEVTAAMVDGSFDRFGNSPMTLWKVSDAPRSIGPGPFPETESVLVWGSVEWEIARRQAMLEAGRAVDREAAYRLVKEKFGDPAPNNTTTWTYPEQSTTSKWSH